MVGAFDPSDDRDAKLLSGVPALAIQDVLLEQGEEALHGGVIAGSPDTAHGADDAVTTQGDNEFSAAKLTSPVAVKHAAGDLRAAGHRVGQGLSGEPRRHPGVHRVADDPFGVHILDRTQVELAVGGLESKRSGVL